MKIFSSQGQQRMAVISLKLSEIYLFKESLNEYPILLLDDVFSEIDIKKRNKIIKYLKNDIQTIITTTDINDINKNLLEKSVVYNVKNNKVTRKGRIKNGR
jgi:DNA replication and repair protein RecF